MSILIRDMKMPRCCDECWAMDDYGDYPRCRITGEQHGYPFRYEEYRMPDCPLRPAPEEKHGRWIISNGNVCCSECGEPNMEWNFCPFCGARMDGEEEE
jgi:hypothetical protein